MADQLAHALERAIIHVFSAASVCMLLRWGLMHLENRFLTKRLGGFVYYGLPCLLAALLVFLREPLDVASGGPLWKSYIDLVSWLIGAVASTRLAYQLNHRDFEARSQIEDKMGSWRAKRAHG